MYEISAASLEYVRVPVTATVSGAPVDPSGDPVSMAFLSTAGAPASDDWVPASWDTAADTGIWYAQCLVGPDGDITLVAGLWAVWVRIIDLPETPVKRAGLLRVT